MPDHAAPPRPRASALPPAAQTRAAAPLWAALSLTFLGSLGTGIVTNGIYFITDQRYAFSKTDNYLLGLALGVTYIIGALGAGPALRGLAARSPRISTRAVLAGVLAVLGLLCFLPILTASAEGTPAAWPIWVLVALYSPLTGVLWPIAESYVSGGRTGAPLRTAIGRFNITWSSALVVAFWALGPALENHALEAVAVLGGVHLLTMFLLIPLGAEPGRHIHEHHEPHPVVYHQLLETSRILLPTSYLVVTALTPYLPTILGADRLNVPPVWHTPIAATWLTTRGISFLLLERWHGWHGRWFLPVAGVLLLLGGFALSVLSPLLGAQIGNGGGLAILIAGLAAFGVGMAAIYAAALYYAMEVGSAAVDAGGTHEALIGLGYTAGPLCGLAAVAAASAGLIRPDDFSVAMFGLTSVAAAAAVAFALRRAWQRASRS